MPGIEPGPQQWKARALTSEPVAHESYWVTGSRVKVTKCSTLMSSECAWHCTLYLVSYQKSSLVKEWIYVVGVTLEFRLSDSVIETTVELREQTQHTNKTWQPSRPRSFPLEQDLGKLTTDILQSSLTSELRQTWTFNEYKWANQIQCWEGELLKST